MIRGDDWRRKPRPERPAGLWGAWCRFEDRTAYGLVLVAVLYFLARIVFG